MNNEKNDKKQQARAAILKKTRRQTNLRQQKNPQLVVALGFYLLLAILVVLDRISLLVAGWYVLLGFVTYAVYAKDKKAAQQGDWRTPEFSLHLLSILGGWVGAMMAQNKMRHKTQKPDFRLTYYLTVIINLAGLLYLISGGVIS